MMGPALGLANGAQQGYRDRHGQPLEQMGLVQLLEMQLLLSKHVGCMEQ